MPRENPPDPPRLDWLMIRSRPLTRAAASSKPSWSWTFWLPWSTISNSLTLVRESGAEPSAAMFATQKSGLFIVVICRVTWPNGLPWSTPCQDASTRVSGRLPATRSNQYQPPSPNGFSGRSKVKVSRPVTRWDSTRCRAPLALDL